MTQVKKLAFATVYVDHYPSALAFYQQHLGYETKVEMGPAASWGKIGEVGLYIEGNNVPNDITPKTVRSSFVLAVTSAFEFFERFKADGVEIVQSEPIDMGQGEFWFQFRDPAGNILEILGGR